MKWIKLSDRKPNQNQKVLIKFSLKKDEDYYERGDSKITHPCIYRNGMFVRIENFGFSEVETWYQERNVKWWKPFIGE